jgi:hypothetical protein
MKKFDNKNENITNLDTEKQNSYKLNLTDLTFQEFLHKLKLTMFKSKILILNIINFFIINFSNLLRHMRLSRIHKSTRVPK